MTPKNEFKYKVTGEIRRLANDLFNYELYIYENGRLVFKDYFDTLFGCKWVFWKARHFGFDDKYIKEKVWELK